MKYMTILGMLVSIGAMAQGHPDHAEREARLQAACGSDLSSLCANAEGREKLRCLMENKTSLSESCATFMARAPGPGRPPRGDGERPPGPPPGEGAGSTR